MVKVLHCKDCIHYKIGHATNNEESKTTICDVRPKVTQRKMTTLPLFYHVASTQRICSVFKNKSPFKS